jgi:hypothetical protein
MTKKKKEIRKSTGQQLARLVIVPIAERGGFCVEDVPDGDIGSEAFHVDHCVLGDWGTERVDAVHTSSSDASGVGILPDAVVVVDEQVVEPEDWVARGGIDVTHYTSNAVVSICVDTTLLAGRHVLEGGIYGGVVARIDPVLVGVRGQTCVTVSLETVRGVRRGAWADVDRDVGECLAAVSFPGHIELLGSRTYAIRHTSSVDVGEGTKIVGREDVGLRESTRIPGLVKPRHWSVEAAFRAQHLLKRPDEVSVPEQKLGVAVDVRRELLVDAHKVVVSGPGSRVVLLLGSVLQTPYGTDEGGLVVGRVRVPFDADTRIGAFCRSGSGRKNVHLGLRIITLCGVY